jgi:SAM-dependent methyltransferase
MNELLDRIKRQARSYESSLPDGTATESYLEPRFRGIHGVRDRALRGFLNGADRAHQSAIDVACHEGFFALTLAEYFGRVTGIDRNVSSLVKARDIAELVSPRPVEFVEGSLEEFAQSFSYDFVLCFGLLYHAENPLQILRLLSQMASRELCIETQILPFEVHGSVEDGSYGTQRPLRGHFGVCDDYSRSSEGGMTDIALVPSREALVFCLRSLGFPHVNYFQPREDE